LDDNTQINEIPRGNDDDSDEEGTQEGQNTNSTNSTDSTNSSTESEAVPVQAERVKTYNSYLHIGEIPEEYVNKLAWVPVPLGRNWVYTLLKFPLYLIFS